MIPLQFLVLNQVQKYHPLLLESTLEPKVMQLVFIVGFFDDHLLAGEVTALDRIVAAPFLLGHFEIEFAGWAHLDFVF